MAPGSYKRKRPERQTSQDEGSGRPSPHRPENMGLARHDRFESPARYSRDGRQPNTAASQGDTQHGNSATSRPVPLPALHGSQSRETPVADTSRPATPAQTSTAQSLPSMLPPAPFSYEFVVDEILANWPERGPEITQAAAQADGVSLGIILQELVRSGIDGRLDCAQAGSVIQQIIANSGEQAQDVQSTLIGALSLLDEADTKSPKLLTLLAATEIDPEVLRQELDVPLLQTLSLVRSTFERMRTRKTTNLLYRQANFNLLREETEGYAKLITEFFNTANDAVENPNVSADDAFQRVTALVGSFDLDVGRVLDITLDISANLLVRAYAFFVRFYRCSFWWPDNGVLDNVKWQDQGFSSFPEWAEPGFHPDQSDELRHQQRHNLARLKAERDERFWARVQRDGMDAFFDLGARNIVDFDAVLPLLEAESQPEFDARNNEVNADRRKRINENKRFMRETRSLPPQGNSDAAQLLGFKLRFYASSARDAADIMPENLVYLAALLIKIGFISLRDLYPHLHPADEDMESEKSRLEKEKREKEAKDRPGAGTNALAMAGALPDDTVPAIRNIREKDRSGASTPKVEKKDEEPKEEMPAPANQKILLLKALLLIGALPEALYILGRFPWIAEVDISLPPFFHRIVRQMLSKVADSVKPIADRDDVHGSKDEVKDNTASPDGTLRFQTRPVKKTTRRLGLDSVDKADGQSFCHYYPDWEQNIPVCQNVDDVFLLCNTFIGFLGVKIGQDAALYDSLIRIAKHDLAADDTESNRSRWLELMKRLLVPALSLSKHNPGLTQSVYELLKFFPTTTRFNIYAEWYIGKTSRLPDIRVAFDHNRAEVKDVLRRVSNETGKRQARALAKVAFASPGIVMTSMINQLESYSNMIPSLVECTRYFSLLAWDVLTWCLLNSLSGQGRDRIQADGMLTSPWLQALSRFVATLFLRYSIINPTPVLQYLASELRTGNSTDLEMLEQVLVEMAGIRSDMEFNDAQVLAMAGGEHLQAQTVLQLADKRQTKKLSALRLVRALGDHSLIGQTLVAIAQERQMYPYREGTKFMPLKVLGNNLDKIQSVFAQYLEVIKTNLSVADFEAAVPDVSRLVGEFGLEPGIAFAICRVAIVGRINEFDAAKKLEAIDKKRDKVSKESAGPIGEGKQPTIGEASSEGNGPADADSKPPATVQTNTDSQPWHPVLESVIDGMSKAAPELAKRVSIPFFVTFWTLTLQDILVHTPSYDKEINKLRDQIKQINADRSDASAHGAKEKDKKKKAATEIQDHLREELKGRIAAYQKTRNRLSRREKDHWFSRAMEKHDIDARHIGLLQECFLPRAMLSSLDAHYCFLMLKILHDNGTPGFSTMHLLNHLLKKFELAAIMFQCTAMEAQHFGRFLCETLKLLQHWHADKSVYEKEVLGGKQKLPGFARKVDANGDPEAVLEFEDFRRLLYNWHSFLNGALQLCFESGEYMHIRNGIIVLRSVVPVFPALNFMGHNIVKQVTKLSEEDQRQDLKLAAMSLLGPLRNREKQWMMPQAFRLNDTSKDGGKARGASAKPDTPHSNGGTPVLNAAAAEFKPGASVSANGTAAAGPEDGEIDEVPAAEKDVDVKMEDASKLQENIKGEENQSIVKGPAPTRDAPKQPSKSSVGPPASTVTDATNASQARQSSTQPASSRPPHGLPVRPESGPPKRPLPALPNDRGGRYPARNEERFGRLDRPGDGGPGSRDHSPNGRAHVRPGEPESSVAERRRPYPREEGYAAMRHRTSGASGASAGQAAPSGRSAPISSAIAGPVASRIDGSGDRSRNSSQPGTPHHENPARMALINDDPTAERSKTGVSGPQDSRRERNVRDERGLPRLDSRAHLHDPPRDQPRGDAPRDNTPSGPRNPRYSRDMDAPQSESTFGRLNSAPKPASASYESNGPPGRDERSFAGSQAGARFNNHAPPSPSTGRSSGGPDLSRGGPRQGVDRRSSVQQHERQSVADTAPATPAADSSAPVHPSRASQFETVASNAASNDGRFTAPAAAPAGPRGARAPGGPPTGPPGGNNAASEAGLDKSRRGDRPRPSITGTINATLQNASSPAGPGSNTVNFRGAAQARQPAVTQAPPSQPQALASAIEPPSRRNDFAAGRSESRQDLFQSRQGRGEDTGGYAGGREPRREDDERFPRSRGSRNTSRERRPDDGPPPPPGMRPAGDKRPFRDERDGRDAVRQRRAPPDRQPRGEGMRPMSATPGSLDHFQPPGWGRGSRDDGPRGGRGGAGPRMEEYRRDDRRDGGGSRGPRDDGPPPPGAGPRKRRHDDMPPLDEAKRRRGGGGGGRS